MEARLESNDGEPIAASLLGVMGASTSCCDDGSIPPCCGISNDPGGVVDPPAADTVLGSIYFEPSTASSNMFASAPAWVTPRAIVTEVHDSNTRLSPHQNRPSDCHTMTKENMAQKGGAAARFGAKADAAARIEASIQGRIARKETGARREEENLAVLPSPPSSEESDFLPHAGTTDCAMGMTQGELRACAVACIAASLLEEHRWALKQLRQVVATMLKGEMGMRVEVWRSATKMDAHATHQRMKAALETQMQANGQQAGVRLLRQVVADLLKGEMGMRVEVWRTAVNDAKRAEAMTRLQYELEAQAADKHRGVGLRQLKRIWVRNMKGEMGMRVEVWRSATKMDAHATHQRMKAALETQMQANGQQAGVRLLRQVVADLLKGEMGMRVEVWRSATKIALGSAQSQAMAAMAAMQHNHEREIAALQQSLTGAQQKHIEVRAWPLCTCMKCRFAGGRSHTEGHDRCMSGRSTATDEADHGAHGEGRGRDEGGDMAHVDKGCGAREADGPNAE